MGRKAAECRDLPAARDGKLAARRERRNRLSPKSVILIRCWSRQEASPMYGRKLFGAIILCLTATLAQAAGLRNIEISADAGGPALTAAVWYPCSQPPGMADLGKISLPGVKDCPLPDRKLPL